MELVERYLDAVRSWLPRASADDILAELADDLRSAIDDRAAAAGRPLTEDEVAAILTQRGHPVQVASGYGPQRSLIGPVLFPIYRRVLKLVALFGLAPLLFVWTAVRLVVPRPPGAPLGVLRTIGAFWSQLCLAGFVMFGVVTIVFAVLEWYQTSGRLARNWDPKRLPSSQDRRAIPRSASAVELAVNLLFCAWWMAAMASRDIWIGHSVHVVMSPAWPIFAAGFVIIAAANAALAMVAIVRPRWTFSGAALRLMTDACGAGLVCWVLNARVVVGLMASNLTDSDAATLVNAIDRSAARAVPLGIMVGTLIVVWGVARLVRLRVPSDRSTAGGAITAIF